METRSVVTILVLALLLIVPFCKPRSCTQTRSSYTQQAYTSYYSTSYGYSYSCGWWGWRRCRGTAYQRRSRTSYRSVVRYNTACCSGYGCGSSCQACCSPSCQHGGTCDRPGICICPSGWSGYRCQNDVNECSGSNQCHRNARCTNTIGSYTCTCNTGYYGNGRTCADRNECQSNNGGCSSRARCRNTIGSYTCSCNTGYQGNGFSCTDVNECVSGHGCDTNAECTNSVGTYSCTCNTGYAGNGFYCNDVNECQQGTDSCHQRATCTNTVGSYGCTCNTGYQGDGFTCRDVNECGTNNGGCDQVCTNLIGSYRCSCRVGYYLGLNGHACEDVDECATENGGCHHNCHNTIGSYHCSCNDNYTLSMDDHTCTVPPLPPTGVQVSLVNRRTARLMWQAPVVTFLNSLTSVSSYQIVARQSSFNISDVVAEVPFSETSYTFPSTLEEFTHYTCEVLAGNSFGYGQPSQPVEFMTHENIPSAAPVVDYSVALSSTLISFHWLPPPSIHINGRLQYYLLNVTEKETGNKWMFHAVGNVLRIGSLHPDYVYGFTVAARTIGNGPYSSERTVRTKEDAPSGTPQYFSVSSKTSNSLTLAWEPPPRSERNGIIRFYTLELEEIETEQSYDFTSNDTNTTLFSLHPYYTYECRVRAETVLSGPYSEAVLVQLDEDAPSSSPTIVAGNATSSSSLLLEWTPPHQETHNGVIRSYKVLLEEVETGLTLTYEAENTSITITSLHPYYMYKCQVQAFTVATGPPSEPVFITTEEDVPSGAPLNISVVERAPSSIIFSWEEPSPELRNGIITSYFASITELPEQDRVFNATTEIAELTVEELHPHTSYVLKVAAVNSVGMGPFSANYLSQTAEDAPSDSPQNVSVVELWSDHALISWAPPPAHLHNGILREYVIQVTRDGENESILHRSGGTSILIPNLRPDTSYNIRVAGHTVEEGPYSATLSLHTLEDVPSGAPVELGYNSPSPSSLVLQWQPPPILHRNGLIINYMVQFTEISTHNSSTFFSNSTSMEVEMLSAFTAYSFSVSAATAIGFGPMSEHLIVLTAEDVPASAPENLTGIVEDSTSISLSWVSPLQGELNGVLQHFQLNIVEEPTSRSFSVNVTGNYYVLSSLHPYYKYAINVAATTVGVGPFSGNITLETHQDAPSGSPAVSELEASSRSVFLSWEMLEPRERNGVITGYTVSIMNLDDLGADTEDYDVSSLNITISDLIPYTTYGVLLTAHTIVGAGPSSALHTVRTHEEAPVGSPTNITAIQFNSTFIHLYWSHPPEDTHYGVIREYWLNVTELETGARWRVVIDAEETEAVITSLHPYYTYHITIVPVTVEAGDNYTEITIRTAESAPSVAPVDLSISDLKSRSFHLSWNPPPTEDTNGIIRKYTVKLMEVLTEREELLETSNTTMRIHSLKPYTMYSVSVSAFTVSSGPFTPVVKVDTLEDVPTGAPMNVSLTAITPTTLHVSWQPPHTEEQNGEIITYTYIIADEEEEDVREGNSTELEVVIEELKPFQLYLVRLSAGTRVGMGPHSTPSLVEMPQDAPSSPPLDVAVVSVFANNFTVEWAPPPEHTHNGIIRGYQLNTTELETGRNFLRETSELFLAFVHLHPYYTYIFTVAALTVSPGPTSEEVVVVTLETVPSSAPTSVSLLLTTSTSFTLSWDPPPPPDHNGVLTHYLVLVTTLSSLNTLSHLTNATQLTIEDVEPYNEYQVEIAAFTKEGSGPYSEPLILQTEQDAPSVPPKNLTIKQVLSRSITLEWLAPEPEQLNGELTHYLIYVTEQETNSSNRLLSTANEVVLDFLHPHYTYSISVSAVTILPGPYTEEVSITTLEDAPSSPPVGIYTEAVSAVAIAISWEPPPFDVRNGIIRQYSILVSSDTAWVNYTQVWLSNNTEFTVTDLAPYVTYHIKIKAHTILPGPYSTVYSVTTLESAPSAPPSNLSLSILNSTISELTFLPPPIHQQNGIIHHYQIELYQRNTSDVSYSVLKQIQVENFPVLIRDLHPFYQYQLSVSAVTVEHGPPSSVISWTMPEDSPNTGALDITATNITSMEFSVEWLPPAHSDRNGIIRGYTIMLIERETDIISRHNVTGNTTSFHFQGLHPAYTYGVEIAAATISQGPYSEPLEIEMAEDVPSGPPADVKENVLNSTAAQISWHPPLTDAQNGDIILYTLSISGNTSNYYLTQSDFFFNTTLVGLYSLRPFTVYTVSIAASTAVGRGPFTEPHVFHTPEAAPSSPPTGLSVHLINSTSFLVKWELLHLNETNGRVRYFLLNITETETSTTQSMRVYGQSKRMENLHPHYTYIVRIATVTVATGPYSQPLTVQTKEAAPSAPPTGITIDHVGSRHVNISWAPPPVRNQNGVIRRYQASLKLRKYNTSEDYTITTTETSWAVTDLLPHSHYHFTVLAITLDHGPESNPLEFLTLEDAPNTPPLSLMATNITSTEFKLIWDAPVLADRNGILRAYTISIVEHKSGLSVLENVEVEAANDVTEFVAQYLIPYTVYNCSVAAVTVAKGPAAAIQVQTGEEAPGRAPEDVMVEVQGPHTINVSWSPPHSQQNGVIRSYSLELTWSDTELVEDFVSNTTSFLLVELVAYSTYFIRVAAVTVAAGPYSELAFAATPEAAPYGPPQNCSVISLSSKSIQLSWLSPHTHLINGVVRFYRVLVSGPSEETVYDRHVGANSLEVTVSDLHPHYLYQCKVAAVTVEEGPSSTLQIQTLEDVPSAAPTSVASTAANMSIFLTWQELPSEEQNGVILQYRVIVYMLAINETQQLETTETSLVLPDLHPFYLYELVVAGETSAGVGPYSHPVLQQLPEARPSRGVENINVTILSPSSVKLMWWPPPREYWNGILTSYTITSHSHGLAVSNGSDLQPELAINATSTRVYQIQDSTWANNPDSRFLYRPVVSEEMTIDQLHEFYRYHFTITMTNSAGDSDSVSTGLIQLPGTKPSGPPLEVEVKAISSTSISISWQPPALPDQNSIINSYKALLENQANGVVVEYMFVSKDCWLNCMIEELIPYTSYTVALAAVSEYGLGPFSPESHVATFEDVPGPPSNVSAQTLAESQVLVTWNPPLHENGVITLYELKLSGNDFEQSYFTSATSRQFLLQNITSREYTLKVRAATSVGFGDYSTEILVNLPPLSSPQGSRTSGQLKYWFGWVVASVVFAVLVVLLLVYCRKYKKIKKSQNNGGVTVSLWMSNPLYEDCDAVEESIRDGTRKTSES